MQLPLPDHIDHLAVLSQVSVDKDVDGFHPENVGSLAVRGREPLFVPCTPLVIDFTSPHLFFSLRFLSDRLSAFRSSPFPGLPNASGAQWHQHRRKACCDLGAKQRRGLPMALLLMNKDATVTVVHSRTVDIPYHIRQADIVVAAVGRAEMVRQDWIKVWGGERYIYFVSSTFMCVCVC